MGSSCSDDADAAQSDLDAKKREQIEPVFEMLSPNFTREDVNDWTNTSLLIPHEPLRNGLETMVKISDPTLYEGGDGTKWDKQIQLFFEWYNDILYFYVHHHHDAEEEIYFPWLVSRAEALPPKLNADHEKLIEMMDAIKNGKDTFYDEKGTLKEDDFIENVKALHKACTKLRDEMFAHLNEEEKIVPGLLRKHKVTQQEEGVVVNKILEGLGLGGNKIMLPWIVDAMGRWGGTEMVTEFLELVPGPILFLYKMWWKDHFDENNKGILDRITSV